MSDAPSLDMKLLLFYAVVVDLDTPRPPRLPGEFTPSDTGVKTKNSEIRKYLDHTRLLKWRPRGKALYLSANDATWRWVGDHLGDTLPRTKAAFLILDTLRTRVAAYMAIKGVRLSDVFAPKPHSSEEIAPAVAHVDQVRQAYLELSEGQYDVRVRLRDLRPRLAGFNRGQQDEILKRMQRDGWLVLYPNDDPQDRNSDDDSAALIIGDRRRDLVYFHREQRQ